MKQIWLDTETLGLDHTKSPLVQIAAVGFNGEEFNGYCIYPDAKPMEAMALATNDYLERLAMYDSFTEEVQKKHFPDALAFGFLSFLKRQRELNNGFRLTLCGHNVGFDLNHLDSFYRLFGISGIKDFFDYHFLDTMTFGLVLKDMGVLPFSQRMSLKDLCKTFSVKNEGAHDALSDIKATMEVYIKMKAAKWTGTQK